MKIYLTLALVLLLFPCFAQHTNLKGAAQQEAEIEKWSKRVTAWKNQLASEPDMKPKVKRIVYYNLSTGYHKLGYSLDSSYAYFIKAFAIAPCEACDEVYSSNQAFAGMSIETYEERYKGNLWSQVERLCEKNACSFDYIREKRSATTEDDNIPNKELRDRLEKIYESDQELRQQMDRNSKASWDSLWATQHPRDSLNLAEVEAIFAQYGYPGKSLVGEQQSTTAMIVVLHQSDLSALERHFPLLRAAAEVGELPKGTFILFIDRLHMRKFGTQLYGTQELWNPDTQRNETAPIEKPEERQARSERLSNGHFDYGRLVE